MAPVQFERKKTYRSNNMTSLIDAIKRRFQSIFSYSYMMISIDKSNNARSLKLCPTAK